MLKMDPKQTPPDGAWDYYEIELQDGGGKAKVRLVSVVDVDIKFSTLVGLLVKVALAAIPAIIVLAVIALLAMIPLGIIGTVIGSLF